MSNYPESSDESDGGIRIADERDERSTENEHTQPEQPSQRKSVSFQLPPETEPPVSEESLLLDKTLTFSDNSFRIEIRHRSRSQTPKQSKSGDCVQLSFIMNADVPYTSMTTRFKRYETDAQTYAIVYCKSSTQYYDHESSANSAFRLSCSTDINGNYNLFIINKSSSTEWP